MRSILLPNALLTASLLLVHPALAQSSGGADVARALASRGIAAHREGRHAEAIALLEEAESHFHAPTHLFFIGAAREAAGDPVGAYGAYRSVVAEPLPNYAPEAFQRVRQQAEASLGRLAPNVATLQIRVHGAPPKGALVRLDGGVVPSASLELPIAVRPGSHRVTLAAANGEIARERNAWAVVGSSQVVIITWESTPSARASNPSSPDAAPDGALPSATDDRSWAGPAIAFSVGGAALVAGAITGGLTLAKGREIRDQCEGSVCPAEYADDAEETRNLGMASTVAFAVAGAAVVTGITLVVVGGSESTESASLELELTGNRGGIRGRF